MSTTETGKREGNALMAKIWGEGNVSKRRGNCAAYTHIAV